MSRRGLLVTLPPSEPRLAVLGVGDLARVIVELPSVPYFRQRCLDCRCRVVRLETQADSCLVAFSVWRYYFGDPCERR